MAQNKAALFYSRPLQPCDLEVPGQGRSTAWNVRGTFCLHWGLFFQCYGNPQSLKFKVEACATLHNDLYQTPNKQTEKYVTALPSPVHKKKNRITKIILLTKQSSTSTSELSIASWGCSWTKLFFPTFFSPNVVIWHRQLAIKSSNTKTLARPCPITAKAVNQVFT